MNKKVIVTALAITAAASAMASEMPWAKDFDSAKQVAAQSGKLIMLDFYVDGDSWCKKLDADTFSDASVIKAAGRFVPIRVNAVKEGADLSTKYNVFIYPGVKFIDANGDIFGDISGYLPPGDFMEAMMDIQDIYKNYPAAQKTLAKNPNDGAANVLMARVDAARRDAASAKAALSKIEAAHYDGPGLAKAYNAVGDLYQILGDAKGAIGYFTKGLDAGKVVADKAYSLVSIMSCYANTGDKDNAKKFAKQLKALDGISKEFADYADQILGGE
ncbi:MAG TPA: thioredoxin fold domain-containing protein [Fimbriimonadaceae bacterium]|nr:thioredoxin fold domain-containing protein [Fimbriimonadaceae bacterium]